MKKRTLKKSLAVFLTIGLLLSFISCGGDAEGRGNYFITILTGPTSGIFFPIGGAFSSHLGSIGYRTSVTATGATLENIRLLMGGQGELAIAMSDAVSQAYNAHGAFEGEAPADNLRVMMGLWPNYVQIVTTADSGIRTFEDLRGRRVGVGAPGSGVELNARLVFEAHGMSYDDIIPDFLAYGQAIEQMQNGLADAAFVTSGLGNATIRQLSFTREIHFIPIEGEGLERLMATHPYFVASVIPREVFDTAVDTVTASVMNVMLVDENLPSSVVYDLLENIYSEAGLAHIHTAHAVAAEHIRLETALRGLGAFTLHDGAAEFFRARGLID
ncbi:MAG: TAXI family TRAP transporter solute-binding subunit [Spirochaetes bacterium]|nr:TAXI family TRAP transporter solute-binding subunit [Spirochaetota bacterium]